MCRPNQWCINNHTISELVERRWLWRSIDLA